MTRYGSGKGIPLTITEICRLDRDGRDLIAIAEQREGRGDTLSAQRIRDYMNRPCDPAPNGSGEYY